MKLKAIKNIVWFKKDLRVSDHKPLNAAIEVGPSLAIFIIEDQWLNSPECSDIHKQFLKDGLVSLREDLKKIGVPFIVQTGSVIELLSDLKHKYDFKTLYSHEETGLNWTYKRDLKVKKWTKDNAVSWHEYKQFAVLRGLKNREIWNKSRGKIIERKLIAFPKAQSMDVLKDYGFDLSSLDNFQRNDLLLSGGSGKAQQVLSSFYNNRGQNYYKELSSPNTAFKSCSRLSPYITWGNISLTEVHHSILAKRKSLSLKSYDETKGWQRSLKSFESRLWWHCHFIQKLESEPEIEFENMNRAFDGMRENEFNKDFFEAWTKGETGFPIIDACMRALIKKGWINFRMRAMLVSFASYQLWLDWKKFSHHLAKHFIDFEPGIHFSQLQMQSGVTGINSIRIYSPTKQTLDQDPEGRFIRKYCPELEALDIKNLANLSEAPPMILQMMGVKLGKNYPQQIIDHKLAYNKAKETVFKWRSKGNVKKEAKKVYQKHGSRKNNNFPNQNRSAF